MCIVDEPSPYYLLIILALAFAKKYILYPLAVIQPNSRPARVYEFVLMVFFFLYATYLIAYEYWGFRI